MDQIRTVDGYLTRGAARHPERIAIRSLRDGEEINYAAMNQLVDHVAARLQPVAERGSAVGIILDDTIVGNAVMHAGLRAGLMMVPLDAELGDRTLQQCILHSGMALILVAEGHPRIAFLRTLPGLEVQEHSVHLSYYAEQFNTADPVAPRVDANDVALLAYTSGTTSDPKAVVLRHRNLLAAYRTGLDCLGIPKRVGCLFRIATLGTLGIHFFFAQSAGATTVLLPRLTAINAHRIWLDHAAEDIDFFYLVPSMVKLLNHIGRPPVQRPRGVAVCAGAPLTASEQNQFQDRFGLPLRNIYGLTEAGFASFFGRVVSGRGTNDIGPARGFEARVVGDEGQVLSPGEVGELHYRGPMVADGYFKNSTATQAAFPDRWLATGDLVRVDDEGNYTITGRKKNVILRGGFTIYPNEVEEAIEAQPGVMAAVVFANSSDVKGDEMCAYVHVIKALSSSDQAACIAEVRQALGAFRAPDRFVFSTEEPPQNSAGKVIIERLSALFDDSPLVGLLTPVADGK